MLMIALDAVVLMVLLKTVQDEDLNFGTAIIVALVTAIGTSLLAMGLAVALGLFGILLAAMIGGAVLGVAVSALFGVEIKRAFLISGLFMAIHIGASIGLHLMLRA
jgi:hypothetical protein